MGTQFRQTGVSPTETGTIALSTAILVSYHVTSSEATSEGLSISISVTQNASPTETGTISLTASVTVGYHITSSESTSEDLALSLNGAAENVNPDITGTVAFDTSIKVDYHMNTADANSLSLNIETSEIVNVSSLTTGTITLDTSIQVGYSLATQMLESPSLDVALTEVELVNNSLAVNTTGILTLNMAAQVSCHLATTETEIVDVVQSVMSGYHVVLSQSEDTGLASNEQAHYNLPETLSVSNSLQTKVLRGQILVESVQVLITLGTVYLHLPLGLLDVAATTIEYGSIIGAIGTAVVGVLKRRRKLK